MLVSVGLCPENSEGLMAEQVACFVAQRYFIQGTVITGIKG